MMSRFRNQPNRRRGLPSFFARQGSTTEKASGAVSAAAAERGMGGHDDVSAEEDQTPAPPGLAATGTTWDDDVAGSFFAAGMSEEALTAAQEREREREALRHAGGARVNRWVYAVAGVGAFTILAFGLAPRGRDAPEPAAAITPAAAPMAAAAPEPAVAQPTPIDEAASAAATQPSPDPPALPTVSVSELRAAAPAVPPPSDPSASAPAAANAPATPSQPPVESTTTVAGAVADPGALAGDAAKEVCAQLLRRGKFADIKVACGRAFDAEPNANLAVQVARNALERERYSEAQAWSRKAIELDDKLGEAFLTLGGAEQGLGHAALARIAYARYLELEPRGPYADDVRALINQL